MIKFNNLEISNFLSYGADVTSIQLDFTEPTLITGNNADASKDGQTDSNGAGKTSILNAISYACYDRVIAEDIEKDKLINYTNKKDMLVCLEFSKDGKFYRIERFRKNKALGGDGIKILVSQKKGYDFDGAQDITPDSVANANRKIEDIMGIPFDIFSRIVVYSATNIPFLSLPSSHASKANQRDMIEELFGLTEITKKAEILKEEIKVTKADISKVEEMHAVVQSQAEKYKASLEAAEVRKNRWEVENAERIEALESAPSLEVDEQAQTELFTQKDALESSIRDLKANLRSMTYSSIEREISIAMGWEDDRNSRLKIAQDDFDALPEVDIALEKEIHESMEEMMAKITDIQTMMKSLTSELSNAETEKDRLAKELESLQGNMCPYCNQNYADAVLKAQAVELDMVDIDSKITKASAEVDKKDKEATKLAKKVAKLRANSGFTYVKEILAFEKRVEKAKSVLEAVQAEKSPYPEDFVETKRAEVENIKADIEKTERDIATKESELQDIIGKLQFSSYQEMAKAIAEQDGRAEKLKDLRLQKNPHVEAYEELKADPPPTISYKEINELTEMLEHQNFLLKLLTKKDSFIRKALIQKGLPFLNSRLKIYLEKLGLPHKVEFMEDMTANIAMFDRPWTFGGLSAGQKARVNIALSFAFRDVLQYRYGKINFIILDECLDVGLSNVGIQHASKMIKEVAAEQDLAMFVISHRDEIVSLFKKVLHVELKNGFSSVILQ